MIALYKAPGLMADRDHYKPWHLSEFSVFAENLRAAGDRSQAVADATAEATSKWFAKKHTIEWKEVQCKTGLAENGTDFMIGDFNFSKFRKDVKQLQIDLRAE
jgi:hypothetical protein